jgi:hypothetical protein
VVLIHGFSLTAPWSQKAVERELLTHGAKPRGHSVVDETVDLVAEVLNVMTEQLTLADLLRKHFPPEQMRLMGLPADLLQVQIMLQVPVAVVQGKLVHRLPLLLLQEKVEMEQMLFRLG